MIEDLARKLRDLLNAWDPLGVADLVDDEYDCLNGVLAGELYLGTTLERIESVLRSELNDHFGLDPERYAIPAFALNVFALSIEPYKAERLTPQEKKQLSYERDRRNAYGENPAASRKGIRFRKRWVNQTNRQADNRILRSGAGPVDEEAAERIQAQAEGRRRARWSKDADLPLGEVLKRRASRRDQEGELT